MPTPIDAGTRIRSLNVLHTNQYRSGESFWVDPPSISQRRVWYSWEETAADTDPYSWTEEYYRIGIPLRWFEPLFLLAESEGRSEGVVPAEYWSYIVRVNTYTGDGGTKKTSPNFDEQSWLRELVLARVTLTPTSVAVEYTTH